MKSIISPYLFIVRITFTIVITFTFPGHLFSQETGLSDLIATDASLELLSGSFDFTEGPAADKEGNVYFTDQPNDRIMVWSIKGELKSFLYPSGRSNGLFFDQEGNLWACADENNEIWKISQDKVIRKSDNSYEGSRFNGPNDLWITPKGKIYFTDPFFQREWWSHSVNPQDKHRVYLYDPEKETIISVEEDLIQPNGIIGTPDGKILYVADNRGNKTWSFSIESDGTLSNKTLFCEMSSDGITIDSEGNLYLTGKGVTVFDKNGNKLGNIPVPENWTANVCFGDNDRQSLFITASKGLYRIRMTVKGAY